MKVLSIDSGIEKTGYAVFNGRAYLTSALIKTAKTDKTEVRLEQIYNELKKVFVKYSPKAVILERLFFFKNQKTAISVAQTQGVVLLLAAQFKVKVHYLTPLQIKLAITGYGQADKKAVQKMIKLTTNIDIKQDDEADAVACGLAFNLIGANSS